MNKIIFSLFASILFISQSHAGDSYGWCKDISPYIEACYRCTHAPGNPFPSCSLVSCTYDDGTVIKDLPLGDCKG